MSPKRVNRSSAVSRRDQTSNFKSVRRGLRSPEIDAEPWQSPLDALARGLVLIGEKFRFRPRLRVI